MQPARKPQLVASEVERGYQTMPMFIEDVFSARIGKFHPKALLLVRLKRAEREDVDENLRRLRLESYFKTVSISTSVFGRFLTDTKVREKGNKNNFVNRK